MSDTVNPPLVNPIALPPVVKGDTEKIWVEVFKDVGGTPIVDKAGQLPLKPQYDVMSVCVYRIEKFLASYTAGQWRDQNNTLNGGSFAGAWEMGEAWLEVRWEPENVQGVDCIHMYYTVRCLRGGWKKLLPEAGWVYLSGGNLNAFMEENDYPFVGKLTNSGGKAAPTATMLLTEWDTKRLIDFSFIGI
jgi:hypothetical protein